MLSGLLPTYLPTYRPYLPTYRPYLPTYLPTYLHTVDEFRHRILPKLLSF
jgi:hypothetical protein